ncbi:MAG: hypothetical protein ACI8ZF_000566 [Candidatus Midichloriaceae bacterium]|jgi:hypothetical protein
MDQRLKANGKSICSESYKALEVQSNKSKQVINPNSNISWAAKEIASEAHRISFDRKGVPTKVLKMNNDVYQTFPEKTIKTMLSIEPQILDISYGSKGDTFQAYPASIYSNFVPLFFPDTVQFIEDNWDIIHHNFPEVSFCAPQYFYFNKNNKSPIELHYSYEYDASPGQDDWQQISFHMSLKGGDGKAAFTVFHDMMPTLTGNFHFYYKYILGKLNLTDGEKLLLDSAYITRYFHLLSNEQQESLKTDGFVPLDTNIVTSFFAKAEYCGIENQESFLYQGYNAPDLKAGEAILFDNFKLHSSYFSDASTDERYSFDLRCYNNRDKDLGFKGFINDKGNEDSNYKDVVYKNYKALGCVVKIFGYKDADEFFSKIYNVTSEEDKLELFQGLVGHPGFKLKNMVRDHKEPLKKHFELYGNKLLSSDYNEMPADAKECYIEYFNTVLNQEILSDTAAEDFHHSEL